MKLKLSLRLAVGLLTGWLPLQPSMRAELALATAASARPNIIFILVDDLGWGDVGVFHQNGRKASGDRALPFQFTPNLDRFASEGARFTHHYVAAPVCASSRSSLLQGVTQGHANVRDNQFDKAIDENHTLATVLREAGYATGAIGKWGVHGLNLEPNAPAHPLKRGFDYYYGYLRHVDGHEHYPKEMLYFAEKAAQRGPIKVWENYQDSTEPLDKCYTTDLFTARAKKWITEQAEVAVKKPFFLYLAHDTPHAVLELPTQAYPAGGGLKGGMQWIGTPGHMISTASGTPDSWIHPDYAGATYDDDRNSATPEKPWPEVYKRYATSVRRLDDSVGDLIKLLQDLKLDDNTLVIFASDNGPSIESYLTQAITPEFFASFGPFDGLKRDLWEGGLRTPAIARWPRHIPAGRVIETPSAMWDWLPTFAQAAGLPAPARADGISLLPALTGTGKPTPRDYLYWEYNVTGRTPDFAVFEPHHRNRLRGQMQAIRQGDLMAVRYNIKSAQDNFDIYQVAEDPKEARNLAGNPNYAAAQIRFKQLALQARRSDPDAPRPYDRELMPASATASAKPGIQWSYFEGRYPWVPDFPTQKSLSSGVAATIEEKVTSLKPDSGLLLTGFLHVPSDGEYTIELSTDTGAVLRLHNATLIDADFGYQTSTVKTATVRLQAGLHPLALNYRHGRLAPAALSLKWSGPGFTTRSLSAEALFH